MEITKTEFFRNKDGLRYKRTINENGKVWWSVQHDNDWYILSGSPTHHVEKEA